MNKDVRIFLNVNTRCMRLRERKREIDDDYCIYQTSAVMRMLGVRGCCVNEISVR